MNNLIWMGLLILATSLTANAQNKFMVEREFNEAIEKIDKKQQSTPHKITNITNFYNAKKEIDEKRTTVTEFISDNISRVVSIHESDGKVEFTYERIKIGGFDYVKDNGKAWVKHDLQNGGSPKGDFKITGEVEQNKNLDQFLMVPATFKNLPARIYLQYTVSKRESENYLVFMERRETVSFEGLRLKVVFKVAMGLPESVTQISTTDYEYNPKDLKIEAPVM